MRKTLVLSDGTRERELHLVGRMVVGRDPSCEISHDDSLLSRRHAEFVTTGEMVTVRDLGSRNGVFVNGVRAAVQVLEPGDVVQIGPLRARFVLDEAAETITPEHLDTDRTALIRNAFTIDTDLLEESDLGRGDEDDQEDQDDEDEEVTRLVPAPRMPNPARATRHKAPVAAPRPVDDDEAPTHFMAAPSPKRVAPDPPAWDQASTLAPPVAVAPPPAKVGSSVAIDSRTYVFGLLLVLAGTILAGALVPILVWRRDAVASGVAPMPLGWVALPVAVALIATYVVGSSITRRITRTPAAGHRRR